MGKIRVQLGYNQGTLNFEGRIWENKCRITLTRTRTSNLCFQASSSSTSSALETDDSLDRVSPMMALDERMAALSTDTKESKTSEEVQRRFNSSEIDEGKKQQNMRVRKSEKQFPAGYFARKRLASLDARK